MVAGSVEVDATAAQRRNDVAPGRAFDVDLESKPQVQPFGLKSWPDAAIRAAGDGLVQAELVAPEGLVSERVVAEYVATTA